VTILSANTVVGDAEKWHFIYLCGQSLASALRGNEPIVHYHCLRCL
jgi:hypothetical protein